MRQAAEKVIMLHAYLLAQSGIPVLYSGDEVFEEGASQQRIFRVLQKLETFRAEHKVFDTQAVVEILETYDNAVLGIKRIRDKEQLIALFNFSDEEKTAWIQEDGFYIDVMSGEQREGKTVAIPASSFCWLYQA